MQQTICYHATKSDEVSQRIRNETEVTESLSSCPLWYSILVISANLAWGAVLGQCCLVLFPNKHAVLFWISGTFLVFVSCLCILSRAQHLPTEEDMHYVII